MPIDEIVHSSQLFHFRGLPGIGEIGLPFPQCHDPHRPKAADKLLFQAGEINRSGDHEREQGIQAKAYAGMSSPIGELNEDLAVIHAAFGIFNLTIIPQP
ncbi:MAG: hypothetical protein KA179_02745 [Sulfuritalea sp.]|nr:hypothetical protein [Sulfuritalea sp.]